MKNWKNNFKNGKELILSTSDIHGNPNANITISLGFFDERLLIADCQMVTTINNLIENPKITIISGYLRLKGEVEIFQSGKYLDICINENENSGFYPKNAILVKVKEVFDLDKGQVIF